MALAPKLEFKQSQQLVMTPQLQQAIKLLQLSNLELAEYVDEQLEKNPFLERAEFADGAPVERRGETAAPDQVAPDANSHDPSSASQTDAPGAGDLDLSSTETLAKASEALDVDYTDQTKTTTDSPEGAGDYRVREQSGSGGQFDGDDREFGANIKKEISLAEHLNDQLVVATRNQAQLFIGAYLIDMIDEAGYLSEPMEAISAKLGASIEAIEDTLCLVQTFDPSGVGARDLKECLKIQLREQDRLDPAMNAFVDNIELLAKGDLKGLMRVSEASEEDVRDMIAEVRALTPKPGYAYSADTVQVVVPDVFVRQSNDGTWKVELNNDTLPRVLVNQHYYAEVSTLKASEDDKTFVNEQMSDANWLVKSLDQRARTILKVSQEIVRQQDAFFAHGVLHLKPLNLKAVAEAISMHESTISRVTANKYMQTPRGLFELKYFFTASIASADGGDAYSAEAIRHRIKALIDDETANTILSDDKIVDILRGDGIDIARRTVAKYRETLNIPSSVQRRRAKKQIAL